MSIKGLDVSEFQGIIDWEQVKAAGYQFAMLRVIASAYQSAPTGSVMQSARKPPLQKRTDV